MRGLRQALRGTARANAIMSDQSTGLLAMKISDHLSVPPVSEFTEAENRHHAYLLWLEGRLLVDWLAAKQRMRQRVCASETRLTPMAKKAQVAA